MKYLKRYETYSPGDDTEPTKEYLDGVKLYTDIRYKNLIDFNDSEVKKFILDCEMDGLDENICGFYLTKKYEKQFTNTKHERRFLKKRPESE